MKILDAVSKRIVHVVDRFLPEPFVFAIIMTGLTIVLALLLTDAGFFGVLTAWGDGLSMLLSFISQMALMVLFAYALSQIEPIPTLLGKLASVPSKPWTAYSTATFLTGFVSLLSWPLGLILGSLFARALGIAAREKGLKLHYPLLGASAFSGFVVWHMGYSASAPLFVATQGNAMQDQLGRLIPVSETIFATWNIIIAMVTLCVVAATAVLLHPKKSNLIECDATEERPSALDVSKVAQYSPAEQIEHSRVPTFVLSLLITAYLVYGFVENGMSLDLNAVNWTFLALGLLLTRSSAEYATAMYAGARTAAPIMLQYPLYGGIMGIMLGTGFVASIAPWFTRIATEHTLPVVAFLFGGVVNFFIPSGGAQWAVQGPAFVEAANQLGTELPLVVMGVAYGDQWTNIIHPFTVIIVLILTGLKARQVIAYSAVMFLMAGVPLGLGLYLASRFG